MCRELYSYMSKNFVLERALWEWLESMQKLLQSDDLHDVMSNSVAEAGFDEGFILIKFLLAALYSIMDLQE